jgi:Protein of unknown function (DUF1153)
MEIVDFTEIKKRGQPVVLPPHDTARWVAKTKAAIVIAIRHKAISRELACERYRLSSEELAAWEAAFEQKGLSGLRVTCRRRPTVRMQLDAPMPRIRGGLSRTR